MPVYTYEVSGKSIHQPAIDTFSADNDHEAINFAVNAMSVFVCMRFPPPESVTIEVTNEQANMVGEISFDFRISYGANILI